MIKNDAWERLGEMFETCRFQDPQKLGAPMLFWTLLAQLGGFWVPLGATWRQMAAQGIQNQSKIDSKIDAQIDAEKDRQMMPQLSKS